MNVVRKDNNGIERAYCPIHDTNDQDDKKGAIAEKNRDLAQDDFRKAFENLDTASIEDITTP